ncbi:hypothetical protein K432DRAFT_421978 [Lepidopterella palustris CBS 459.81]|uniref:Mediator of RNA polymerase II transcription subunit 4 n=1 Tax=Lepidopterella palustris CBS 459.81 TaxID=1314670 RepID=A0A8E2EJH3_9PEZI|nr:hypothetical protein K432DRAFT_421978 [Lepidopterella palustris CBS 459.81]
MDTVLQTQFQRVENALNTLIESITSYNPSPQAAVDLVAADDELSKGLGQLAAHQANYARILSLRQTAESLESQVKGSLSVLADLRRELLKTPATTFPASSRDVPFDEVLAYARHISRYTVPPTFRPPLPKEDTTPEQVETGDVKVSNGVGTPAAVPDTTEETANRKAESKGMSSLTKEQRDWLEHQDRLPFVPWPAEGAIRRGGLGQIQAMIEQGKDPSTVLGPAEQEAEEKRRAEQEQREKEEQEEREAEARSRRESIYQAGSSRQQQAPAVFSGLDMYDSDDL